MPSPAIGLGTVSMGMGMENITNTDYIYIITSDRKRENSIFLGRMAFKNAIWIRISSCHAVIKLPSLAAA